MTAGWRRGSSAQAESPQPARGTRTGKASAAATGAAATATETAAASTAASDGEGSGGAVGVGSVGGSGGSHRRRAGVGWDGGGGGGEGDDVVVGGGGGGAGGGWAASSAATVLAGWAARALSARPNPRSTGHPGCGARHEESNLEPRQLGAAEADHHRGRNAPHSPCERPRHSNGQPGKLRLSGQPSEGGQTVAPGQRGGAHLDSRNIALELPTSGRDPALVHLE